MKNITTCVVMGLFLMASTAAIAKPNPNQKAYDHANENARFKRDVSADVDRTARRAKRQLNNDAKKMEREAKKASRNAERQTRKLLD